MATIGGMDGTVAVVTGGGSGIGRAVVELLERSGTVVRVIDVAGDRSVDVTNTAALDRVAAEIGDADADDAGFLRERDIHPRGHRQDPARSDPRRGRDRRRDCLSRGPALLW